ncbi:hypothetical protein X797_004909 [Metarhizium robertsii]|uniref:Uncharacterized protein n=1 Tax=Metarhizium robertsii TaxID=568076 RepID=A0A0A1UVR9_9HYPO|nr:hypothetical protein X797_004909 [Metarhizium robertsii]
MYGAPSSPPSGISKRVIPSSLPLGILHPLCVYSQKLWTVSVCAETTGKTHDMDSSGSRTGDRELWPALTPGNKLSRRRSVQGGKPMARVAHLHKMLSHFVPGKKTKYHFHGHLVFLWAIYAFAPVRSTGVSDQPLQTLKVAQDAGIGSGASAKKKSKTKENGLLPGILVRVWMEAS